MHVQPVPSQFQTLVPVVPVETTHPLIRYAVSLADRRGLDWADFLYLLEKVELYLALQGSDAPPPTDL